MKTFQEYIREEFEVDERKDGDKEVSVFLGRMQPPHKAHQLIIKSMKNPIVLLVKGKATSEDKKRNPFDEKYQIKLLKKLCPGVEVRIVNTGYLPEIAAELRKEGKELVSIHAGEDRMGSYKSQFDRLKLDPAHAFHIKYIQTPDEVRKMVSATQVRTAIKNGNEEAFKEYMPKPLWGEFETMKKKLQ